MAYCSPNILDIIESVIEIPPLWRLRCICKDKVFVNLYNYPFERYALGKLPPEYGPLRVENSIGFNVFMSDEEVSKQELQHNQINTKAGTDRLLALIQQEKLAKREKSQQQLTKKEKSAPETKAANADSSGESQ
jgi:hypothetical protein